MKIFGLLAFLTVGKTIEAGIFNSKTTDDDNYQGEQLESSRAGIPTTLKVDQFQAYLTIGGGRWAGGVLVGERRQHVLTVASVVRDAKQVKVEFDDEPNHRIFSTTVTESKIHVYPGFDLETGQGLDLVVLELDQPLTQSYFQPLEPTGLSALSKCFQADVISTAGERCQGGSLGLRTIRSKVKNELERLKGEEGIIQREEAIKTLKYLSTTEDNFFLTLKEVTVCKGRRSYGAPVVAKHAGKQVLIGLTHLPLISIDGGNTVNVVNLEQGIEWLKQFLTPPEEKD